MSESRGKGMSGGLAQSTSMTGLAVALKLRRVTGPACLGTAETGIGGQRGGRQQNRDQY